MVQGGGKTWTFDFGFFFLSFVSFINHTYILSHKSFPAPWVNFDLQVIKKVKLSYNSVPEVEQSLRAFQPQTDPLIEERAIFWPAAALHQDPQQWLNYHLSAEQTTWDKHMHLDLYACQHVRYYV